MKLHILRILDRVEGDGLSTTTLRLELELMTRTRPGELELATALSDMRSTGLLYTVPDDLTGDNLWRLTPAGTTRSRL